MENPTIEMFHRITREFALSKALAAYSDDRICFGDHEADMLVDMLWNRGNRSCRTYQKAVELLVSKAYLSVLESNHSVQITEQNVRETVIMCSHDVRTKSIGFNASM